MDGKVEAKRFDTIVVEQGDEEGIKKAAEALKNGEVVGMPTETVYGLGADAKNPEAVKKIYVAKGRPSDNPLIVHVANKDMITPLVKEITPVAKALIDAFMPGPITVIMKKSDEIPSIVSAGLDTVGIRFPIHPIAQKLISESGVPVAAPSANLSGSPSPTKVSHVVKDMFGRVPYIVDGGECQVGLESTVVDATGKWPQILRPGKITIDQMEEALKNAGIEKPAFIPDYKEKPGEAPRSPGMKYRHYAPSCEVDIVGDGSKGDFENYYKYYKQIVMQAIMDERTPVGLYVGEELAERLKILFANKEEEIEYYIYGDTENVEDASHGLFDGLRTLDEKHVQLIVAPAFPEEGLGIAYMNRLKKAASQAEEVTIRNNHRRICFVCSGNTCRSPLAEAIFRSIFRQTGPHYMVDDPKTEGKVIVTSAGTFAKGDEPYTVSSVKLAKYEYDEDISTGYSKIAIKERLINQDLILTMTGDGSRYLRTRFPDLSDRIFSFQEILDDLAIPNVDGEVSDPYGYDYLVYMETAKQIDKIIRALLPELLKKWGMS